MKPFVRIHEHDNVAVAVVPLQKGETALGVTLLEDIPAGHKFALTSIPKGDNVIKYAAPIGHATADIPAGAWVHTHNVKTNLSGTLEYTYNPQPVPQEKPRRASFRGYRRADGRVGTRNEIWIINTVGCVNASAQALARAANEAFAGRVDGVHCFTHPYGCSQMGGDHETTQRLLAALVRHPNAAGVLVLGLGCENNNIPAFRKVLGEVDERRVKFLSTQDVEDEMEAGMGLLRELCEYAETFAREEIDASELIVGLKCGGSDGLSGITANPLLGRFSDRLTACGGTTLLTEVPEMFGAETLLMNRCRDEATFQQAVGLINDFKEYFIRHGQVVYENPSPGNKAGGITTLEDKSLGCTQKGGTGAVCGVYGYAQAVDTKGLNLVYGPGNDLCAMTALCAAGAQVVLFTTGRGTPVGGPVPTVKVATNTPLWQRKQGWIDFNAGVLVQGQAMEQVEEAFFEKVLRVASGEETCSERSGDRQIAIFKDGVTL
jgi:altronate hydrolase